MVVETFTLLAVGVVKLVAAMLEYNAWVLSAGHN